MISSHELANKSLEEENHRLLQINESLNEEISRLKQQFEKTISLSQSLEDSFKKNSELSATVRKVNEEKEDLKHRLQISLQTNQELQTAFVDEKNNMRESFDNEIKELNNQFSSHKEEMKSELIQKQKQIASLKNKIQELEVKSNLYETENKSVYQILSSFFNLEISSIEDLQHILADKSQIQKEKTNQESYQEANKESYKAANKESYKEANRENIKVKNQKVEKSKKKVKENFDPQILHEYENIIEKLKAKNQKNRISFEQFITAQNKEIESMKNEFEQKEKEFTAQIHELKNKNERQASHFQEIIQSKDEIIQENARLKTQLQCQTHEMESKFVAESLHYNENLNKLTVKLHQTEESNEKLKKQLPLLLEQLKSYKNLSQNQKTQISEFEKTTKENEETILKNTNSITELKNEKENLKENLKNSADKINEVTLKVKELESLITEKNVENKKLRAALEHSSISLESQKNEFLLIRNERDELLTTVSKNESQINNLQSKIGDFSIQIRNLENELSIAQKKLLVAAEPINEPSLLPLATWAVGDFPEELSNLINDISNNQTLKTPSKLKQIFSLIIEWYQKKTSRVDHQLDESNQKLFELNQNVSTFTNLLTNAINFNFDNEGKMVSIDSGNKFTNNIINDEKVQKEFVYHIENLKNGIKKQTQTIANYETQMIDFLVFMNSDNLISAREKVEKFNKKIEKLNRKIAKYKKKIIDLSKNYKNKEKEYIETIQNSQKSNDQIQNEFNKSQQLIQSLQSEVSNLQSQNEETSSIAEQKIHDVSIEFEAKLSEFEKQNIILSEKVSEITKLREKSEESKIPLKTEINHHQKTIQFLTQKNDKKNHEIKELKKQKDEEIQTLHDLLESNRATFHQKEKKYKSLIKKITNEFQSEFDHLQDEIKSLELQKNALISQNDELSFKIEASELKMSTLSEDYDRQKRLFESQMKAESLSKEVSFNYKLEECRKKLNEAKINLMGFVASKFCCLFDSKESLDESNFEVFINNVSLKLNELLNMEINLRELLRIGPKQSIEDAISSLLLK
ncbi:hypothetical protein TRFO_23730 [Tritrichomonas foetus]|uniref:Uncharacterized protein n=1 Tax=Tritrichomonas foetus TaxID=1144522 RepID=A0A1J4K8Y7_9EUKA|nr:hypothetical protein TRFO_23730 [Tritrichomonas foetus]|eukprot:OHT07871.1 hypothetical protein TRFO_23730 [Tritrichomonas foetus]